MGKRDINYLRFLITASILFYILIMIFWISLYTKGIHVSKTLHIILSMAIIIVVFSLTIKSNLAPKVTMILTIMNSMFAFVTFLFFVQSSYPTVLGRDPWVHFALTKSILYFGHIPDYLEIPIPYVNLPGFHLIVGTLILISDLNYKWASVGLAGITVFSIITFSNLAWVHKIFPYIRHYAGAVLLVPVMVLFSDNVLSMSSKDIIPNTIGATLAFLILMLTIVVIQDKRSKLIIPLLILIIDVAITHSISSAIVMSQFLVLLFVSAASHRDSEFIRITTKLGLLSIIISFSMWGVMKSTYYLRSLVYIVIRILSGVTPTKSSMPSLPIPFHERVLAIGGILLFILLSITIYGHYIYAIFTNKETPEGTILPTTLGYIGIVFLMLVGSMTILYPPLKEITHRFWYYFEIVGWAFIISRFYMLTKSSKYWRVILSMILIGIVIFMTNDTIPINSPSLFNLKFLRTGWSCEEVAIAGFLFKYSGNRGISSDFDFYHYLPYYWKAVYRTDKDISIKTPTDFNKILICDCMFVYRSRMFSENAFYLGPRNFKHVYYPNVNFNSNRTFTLLSYYGNIVYNIPTEVVLFDLEG